jgi:hypothetical protein
MLRDLQDWVLGTEVCMGSRALYRQLAWELPGQPRHAAFVVAAFGPQSPSS